MLTATPANAVIWSREPYTTSHSQKVSVIFNDPLFCLSTLLVLFICFTDIVKTNETHAVNLKKVGRCACCELLNHSKCDRHGLLD